MALVSKILETTLTAGSTAVTFTDSDIPNSLIRVFSSNSDIIPVSRILSENSLTVTYAPQTSNMDVAVEIVKAGIDIVDNLESTDADKALSAKQGKLLKDDIDTLSNTVDNLDIPDNITDLDDVDVTSIEDGQVLVWDEDTQKFVNKDQSTNEGIIYSLNETKIGKWIDDRDVYQRVFQVTTAFNINNNSWSNSGFVLTGVDLIIKSTLIRGTAPFTVSTNLDASKNLGFQTYSSSLSIPVGCLIIVEYVKTV